MTLQFHTLIDLLWMKGHGPYVWASYVITLMGIFILGYLPGRQKCQLFKLVRAQMARQRAEAPSSTVISSETKNVE